MEIYKGTGVTTTGELRITRPISALVIGVDKAFVSLLSAITITAFIEKANGNNVELMTNIKLNPYILSSTFGESAVFESTSGGITYLTTAYCELTEEGAINLGENESIKLTISGFLALENWVINGIEAPIKSDTIIRHDRKVVLTEDVQRTFNVDTYDTAVIVGVSNIDEIHVLHNNGETTKHTGFELISIAHDVDNVVAYPAATVLQQYDDSIVFPLIGIDSIQIFKSSGLITLTLKDSDVPY